jgi:AraC-like DNA-binding protein
MQVIKQHISHPGHSLQVLRIERSQFYTLRHSHTQLELTWIERGSGLRMVGDTLLPFTDGDLVLVGSGVPHVWLSDPPKSGKCIAHVLQFRPELILQSTATWPELEQAAPLLEQSMLGLNIRGEAAQAIAAQLQAMHAASRLQRLAHFFVILNRLIHHAQLQPIAGNSLQATANVAETSGRSRIDKVVDWIHQRYAQDLLVEQAAQLIHISPAAFSRFFRREMGQTFTDYVNHVRCTQACLQLRQNRWPIAQIAHNCGYPTLSHFNRCFQQHSGMTARQYRKSFSELTS